MQMRVVCTKHDKDVSGVFGLIESETDMQPRVEDLPDNAGEVLRRPSKTWLPDTSAMYCLGGSKDVSSTNEDDCQLVWEIHVFGDEGAWLTYG